MALDNYASALVSMIGMTFDSVGGLYLAYDLLGGERGPLSKITRIVTYSLIAIMIYASAANLKFALVAGIGLGSIFGLQLDWIGAGKVVSRNMILAVSLARMIILGIAASFILPTAAACLVGTGAFFGSMASHRFKLSPEFWYEATTKPVFNIRRLGVGLLLGSGMALLVYIGMSMCGEKNCLAIALRLGLTVGLGTALIATISPFVEWYADNMPPKRMGYIGVVMFMTGFAIQSLPSLIVLLGL